ncbi:MAG: protein kinase [Deltaproteobacteria bacterium]|nr:protein kinase [Deltaproteobacteria bacterium]
MEGVDPFLNTILAGRYEVVNHVGGGVMGSVYRGRQRLLDRDVAIKVLRGEDVDGRARRRLHREARAVARIRNPHVVQVHDYGETEDGDPFLVMELVPGPTVGAWARTSPPVGAFLDAADGMLTGLAAAHARDVLHRDLKPANMLIRDGDPTQLVLVDFGIAAVLSGEDDGDDPLTREGTVVGTPLYMSPEQALGQPVRPESDVYAVGIILYEWFSGRPPFTGPVMEVMRSHAFRVAPRLSPAAHLEVPALVIDVVQRSLAKHPRDRYPSAAAMRDALRKAQGAPSRSPRAAVPTLPSAAVVELPPTIATGQLVPREPFLGRDEELSRLHGHFNDVAGGRGGIVFVEGVEGVGCSRLVAEFVAGLAETARAHVGRGAAVAGVASLAPLRQSIEDLLGSRSLGLDHLRQRLAGTLSGAGATLSDEERAALIAWLRPESDAGHSHSEAGWSDALVERFLRLVSRERPVVLSLDDFESGGPAAQGWLASFAAAQRLDPYPVWVMVTRARRGESSGEWSTVAGAGLAVSDVVVQLPLKRLPDPSIVAIVEANLPLTPQASGAVAAKAAGLPLVALQLIRHLEAGEQLVPVGSRMGIVGGMDLRDALPGSLRELWGHRIDAATRAASAPDLAERLLDVAAGLGLQFLVDDAVEGLTVLGTDAASSAVDEALDELIAAGVFAEPPHVVGDQLAWEHPSLRDLVLARLGASRRGRRRARELARFILGWEAPARDRLAESTVRLLELSGADDELPGPALVAGLRARDAGRLGDAARLLALSSVASAPDRTRRAALEAGAEVARLRARYEEAIGFYEGLADGGLVADGLPHGRLLIGWGRALLGARRPRDAAQRLVEGIEVLTSHLPHPAAARETSRGLAALQEAAQSLTDIELPDWSAESLRVATRPQDRYAIAGSLGVLAARAGDMTGAMAHHREAVNSARAAHHRSAIVTALYDLGWAERRAGRTEDALTHLTECTRLASALGRHPMVARAHNELGELYRGRGALEAAAHHYGESAALLHLVPGPGPRLAVLNLARLEAERGRGLQGREQLRALEDGDGAPPVWLRGPFSLTLALCEAGHDDAAARAHLREGLRALPPSADARYGAIEILDALAERWEASDEVVSAKEARSAAGAIARALAGG